MIGEVSSTWHKYEHYCISGACVRREAIAEAVIIGEVSST